MYCTNCGNKIDKDMMFCTFCGSRVEDVASPQVETAQPVMMNEAPVTNGTPVVNEATAMNEAPVANEAPVVTVGAGMQEFDASKGFDSFIGQGQPGQGSQGGFGGQPGQGGQGGFAGQPGQPGQAGGFGGNGKPPKKSGGKNKGWKIFLIIALVVLFLGICIFGGCGVGCAILVAAEGGDGDYTPDISDTDYSWSEEGDEYMSDSESDESDFSFHLDEDGYDFDVNIDEDDFDFDINGNDFDFDDSDDDYDFSNYEPVVYETDFENALFHGYFEGEVTLEKVENADELITFLTEEAKVELSEEDISGIEGEIGQKGDVSFFADDNEPEYNMFRSWYLEMEMGSYFDTQYWDYIDFVPTEEFIATGNFPPADMHLGENTFYVDVTQEDNFYNFACDLFDISYSHDWDGVEKGECSLYFDGEFTKDSEDEYLDGAIVVEFRYGEMKEPYRMHYTYQMTN